MAAYTTIDDPSAFFKVQLYTGNGSANHAITFDDTDTDMQPDLVWIKNRDATDSHCLFDAVRGATKLLIPDTNAAEATDADTVDSFASDGFQVDADVKVNTDGEAYASWNWKAGTTSGISGGTITPSSYSINTTSKFGIYAYTGNSTAGATIAHGLGSAPGWYVAKRLNSTASWSTYHKGLGATKVMRMDTTVAVSDTDAYFNDTEPTSTVFSFGADADLNNSSGTYVCYAWSEVQGYSKFGSYTGNGNADGTFVYTGFRPAFLIIKLTGGTDSWMLMDSKRLGYNPFTHQFFADGNNAEYTTTNADWCDLLSNGFKIRDTDAGRNGSGSNYIFMAFAEAPFVNSEGVPCNAR